MTSKIMMCFLTVLLLGMLPVYGDTALSISGTWNEVYGSGGPGSAGGTIDANMAGSGFTLILDEAVHQGVMSSPPAVAGVYVTDYIVSTDLPATLTADDESMALTFSNMILNVTSKVTDTPPTFTMTTQAIDDSGCYCLEVSFAGVVEPNLVTTEGQGGTLSGTAVIKPLTFTFDGTWGEVYGDSGAGSAGGTITALMAGAGWDVNLPSAIHQGVTSGPDPWLTEYVVDLATPATITNAALGIDLAYSNLTLTVSSYTNAASPYFRMQVAGMDDTGLVYMSLCAVGLIDATATAPFDLSGTLSGGCQLIFSLPQASTHAAKNITSTAAMLTGSIVCNGGCPCQVRYHYGIEGGSIMTTPWQNIRAANFTQVTDLIPETSYSYLMELKNRAGSQLGEVRNFTTLASVAISSTEGGTVVEPGEGLCEVEGGTIVDINAVTEDTHTFVAWTGSAVDAGLVADPNAPVTTVEVTGDLTLVAEFLAKPQILWVTEARDVDSDGIQDDQDWIDMLCASGYYVVAEPDRYKTLGDEKDVNDANDYLGELNAADLVVISRSSSSGNYAGDANEIANWNSVMTPMICLSAYHVRSSKLVWVDSTSIENDNVMPFLTVADETHPIFEGVTIDGGAITLVDIEMFGEEYQGTTFVSAADMGNATVLGSHLAGYPWIAEWTPGAEYYDGAGQIAGGKRMMFMAGTQETKENDIYYPQGAMNLTDAGVQVFLNAVDYMLTFKPVNPGIDNLTHQYTFEDGTAADLVGGADGTLVGDANNVYIADGALVTTDQDVWMSMPGDVIDINSYEAATIECWYTPEAGANTSWSMLAYLGSNEGAVGQDGWFITSARADDKCRAAISTGSTEPWADESGVDRAGNIDDGLLHHMVSTLDADEITFYIDGVLMGSTALADADNSLSELSNDLVYLAKGGYDSDPEWVGQIQKFAIYNKALSTNEVLYLYLAGE